MVVGIGVILASQFFPTLGDLSWLWIVYPAGLILLLVQIGLAHQQGKAAPTARKVTHQPRVSMTELPQAAPNIFISYRRSDSLDVTGRIYDRLLQT